MNLRYVLFCSAADFGYKFMSVKDSCDPTPYATLTPDCVLNALDSLGDEQVLADGRLLALNSYENRVYQNRHGGWFVAGGQILPARALDG